MLILVKLIGIVIVSMGITLFLSPKTLSQLIAFWQQGKRIYMAGILRLLIGIILLLAASQGSLAKVVSILGILILVGGILIFILGKERIKSLFDWWNQRPPLIIRLLGLIVLAIGALLIYSV